MQKKIIAILIACVIFIGGYFIINNLNKPKVIEGEKEINLTINNQLTNEIYYEKAIKTNALLFGELLDEFITNNEIEIEFAGNKNDVYGRYIVSINGISEENAYWIINSDNNEQCLNDGYCSGIDMQAINDKDNFSIDLSYGY